MAKTATYGECACGCGDAITHEGSSYAGTTAEERTRHRAKAAYKRKQGGGAPVAGTREALATLGLADDVSLSDLAATLASASAELSRRVAGVDTAEVQRQIAAGLAESRTQVEAAEARVAKLETSMSAAADQLRAAVGRAEQADADAVEAAERAAELAGHLAEATAESARLAGEVERLEAKLAQEVTRADRAEGAYAEATAGFDRAVAEARRSIEAEVAVQLADQRTEHERDLGKLREEIVRLNSKIEAAPRPAARGRGKAAAAEVPATK